MAASGELRNFAHAMKTLYDKGKRFDSISGRVRRKRIDQCSTCESKNRNATGRQVPLL